MVNAELKPGLSANPKTQYAPGQVITYSVSLTNTGLLPSQSIDLSVVLSTITTLLANNNDPNTFNADDIPAGKAFSTWAVEVIELGANSSSTLGLGAKLTDIDLADTVTLAPGENVIYSIKATSSVVTIGDITAVFIGKSADGLVDFSLPYTIKAIENMTTPKVTKKAISDDYVPGGWVDYEIMVENPDRKRFANNFTIVDQLSSCLKVQMNDGTSAAPFEYWILDVKKEELEGSGSDPGAYSYGTQQTGDINQILDIGPRGKVVYTLKALVKPDAIGTILDNGEGCPDTNVIEDGAGLDTPSGKPEVLKEVDKFYYTAGETVTFTITIKNSGRGPLTNIPIFDDVPSLTALDIYSKPKAAASTWTIEAKAVDSAGKPSTNSDPDLDGTIAPNKGINTHANIFPGDSIIYTIVVTLSTDLTTDITNKITVGDGASSQVTTHPKKTEISVNKSVDRHHYVAEDGSITYTIVVSNHADAGFARDIPVDDDIQNIEAELLHSKGTKANVFKSWDITTKTDGAGSDAGLNADWATAGLHAKANIAAGGSVTYTIVGTIADLTQDHIVWGKFSNTVKVTTPDGQISDMATTGVKIPDIRPKKSVDVLNYEAGKPATYTIVIENAGNGYANDTRVTDSISSLGLFSSWIITYSAPDIGSRVIQEFKPDDNIDTLVDIAPHSSITFTVKGIVVGDISGLDKVTNTVNTHDPVTDRDASSSADLNKDPDKVSFGVTKYGSGVYFTPGKVFTYTITLQNEKDDPVEHLKLFDPMTQIKADLANDKKGTHNDVKNDHPFIQWRYNADGAGWTDWITDDITIGDFSLAGKAQKVLLIECQVKDNVVSRKITNEVDVIQVIKTAAGERSETKRHASVDSLRADSGGLVTRSISPRYYKPGDEVTLTIKASSAVGYFNNVSIKDAISKLTVDTIDNGPVQPFGGQWTVTIDKKDTHSGGTTDGTSPDTGIAEDNNDLDVIIDVGGGDSVTYIIKGLVVDDASGEIVDGDDVVYPYEKEYRYTKTTVEDNYVPGSPLTYKITIKNTGKKHLVNLPFVDTFSTIMVEDTKGNKVKAFTDWTIAAQQMPITVDPKTGAKPAYEAFYNVGTVENNKDINTLISIPIGGEIVYTVEATVIGSAIGAIANNMVFDGNSTGVITNPEVNNAIIDKSVGKTFNIDGEELKYLKYMPGGTVHYNLRVLNTVGGHTFGGNIVGLEIIDKIKEIQTKWFDGSKGRAFDSWTVKVTTDGGGVTTADPVPDNTDIDQLVTIGVDGWVNYEITAVIAQEAVGSIINNASAGKAKGGTKPIKMMPAQFSLAKAAFSDAAFTQPKESFAPGDTVYYKVRLSNPGYGTFYKKHVKDLISEVNSTTGTPAFSTWDVKAVYTKGRVTNVNGFVDATKVDINTDIDIAPREQIDFNITAVIADDATGVITNVASSGGQSDDAVLYSEALIDVKFYVDDKVYIPGQQITYHLEVTNSGELPAENVKLQTAFTMTTGQWVGDEDNPPMIDQKAFNGFSMTCETGNPASSCGTYQPENIDLNTAITVASKDTVKFTIVPTVFMDMLSNITVYSQYDFNSASSFFLTRSFDVRSEILSAGPVIPVPSEMTVTKSVNQTEFGQEDESLSYTLMAVNSGQGNLEHVHLVDDLKSIVSNDGKPIFKSWTFNAIETKDSGEKTSIDIPPNQNLDLTWNFDNNSRNRLDITIQAFFQGNIDKDIINLFSATTEAGNIAQDDAKAYVNRQSTGEGDLVVTKSTQTPQIQPGGAVEYDIVVENPNDSFFENVSIIDQYPAGFRYIEGTGKMRCTQDDSFKPMEPIVSTVLEFKPIDLDPFYQCRIRYVLKASLAIGAGSYKNIAFANSDEGNKISNDGSAVVAVTGDKLFDTASIIGKVFEDHNGNGYQSDATAKNIRVWVDIPMGDYVAESTVLKYGNEWKPQADKNSILFHQGIEIPTLWGASYQVHGKPQSASVIYKSTKGFNYPVNITSKTGSAIKFKRNGAVSKKVRGNLAKGLNSEDLHVTTKVFKEATAFRHEIEIINQGKYDDGIPGVRLITAEGFKLETDEHGRFHVPDRWILDNKGSNFLIKVDTDSLPAGMQVISENPKVLRLTLNKLNKFNFSVQRQ